ncbi:MAG: DUF1697 domain-containing protein [Chloroflexota bacterium]
MTRYVALLRGINLGRRRVKMEVLRELVEQLGMARVSTFIASGNVIFETFGDESMALEERLEAHFEQSLGYAVPTVVRTAADVERIAGHDAFPGSAPPTGDAGVFVSFLKHPPTDMQRDKTLALATPTDELAFAGRELYWLCRTRMSESPLFKGDSLAKNGPVGTMRKMTTVRELAARMAGPG